MALPDLSEYDKQAPQKKLAGLKKVGLGVMIAVVLFLCIQSLPQKGGLEGTWKWEGFWPSGYKNFGLTEGSVTLKLEQDGAYEQTVTPCVGGCRWCSGEGIEGLRQLLKLPAMSPEQEAYERSGCDLRHTLADSMTRMREGPDSPRQTTYVTTGEYDIRDGRVLFYKPGTTRWQMEPMISIWGWALNYDSQGNLNDDYLHSTDLNPHIDFSLKKQ